MDATTIALIVVSLVALGLVIVLVRGHRERDRILGVLASYVRGVRNGDMGTVPTELPGPSREIAEVMDGMRRDFDSKLADAADERDWLVSVLSAMRDSVVVTDRDGVVLLANRALLQRVHVSESRAVGRLFIEVVRDHEANEVVRRCLATGVEQREIVETEPGRSYVNVTATPLRHRGGCVVVLQDVTELRRLEKVRRDFVANVSHELRTPLASLKLLAETIGSGAADDPSILKDYMGRIEVEVDRLAQMVDELGELSLIETGQVALDREPVKIEAMVTRSIERLEAQAVRAGISLELDIAADLPQPLADERRLEQVLVNLLHNAIKFTPPGGRVSVSAESDDHNVTITITDTGIGIAEDDLPRIFERFYKADKSRSNRGTGLGLAIARHVIEAHGGTIRAKSREGSGSVFVFNLPLRHANS
ncbi:MAG: sensor histidine kinase [Chloroflexota bacterium]